MERLAGAILLQAIKDAGEEKYASDIQAFLDSQWFAFLVEMAGFDEMSIAPIRTGFAAGNYQQAKIRAAYR